MNTISTTNLGSYLHQLRLTQGWPMRETAQRVQCAPTYISMLEKRQRRPSVGMLYRLVSVLSGDLDLALALLAQENGVDVQPGGAPGRPAVVDS